MPTYEFEAVLADIETIDEVIAERLFEAGCDDGTPTSRNGVVTVGFAREADSLEDAVRSAIRDVTRAGYRVTRVDPTDRSVYTQINGELAKT